MQNTSETVIVTGAAGFIGSHLCERYLKNGYKVVGVDNFSTGVASNIDLLEKIGEGRFCFFKSDISESWDWFSLVPKDFSPLKYIFHFASPASPKYFETLNLETIWANTSGLEKGIQLANAQRAKLIFASTSEVYGDPQVHPQPEEYWGNVNPAGVRASYNESKRLGETLISCHNQRDQTNHGIVRIFNTYGPRMNLQDGRVIVKFCIDALKKKKVDIYGDGRQTRSFCYIDDMVDAIVLYADLNLSEPVNIGSDEEISVRDLAMKLRSLFPEFNLSLNEKPLPQDDPKRRRPDLTKAKFLLKGWKSKVSLDTGLHKMISWVQSEI